MKPSPRVSVVIAARNYGRYLAEALTSLQAQQGVEFEAVIIDDGSTDETSNVVQRFLDDPRLRYVAVDGLGQPAAKNLGVRLTRGELVAFLDADDSWAPGKLAAQVACFDADPTVGVVCTGRVLIGPDGRATPAQEPTVPRGEVLSEVFARNFLCFSSVMVRRSLFERLGGFDPRLHLAIDYDLWLRFFRVTRLDALDAPLVRYRTGHASLSSRILDRLFTVGHIMDRFVHRRGGRETVPAHLIAHSYSRLWQGEAILQRFYSFGQSLRLAVKAVWTAPSDAAAWHTLAYVIGSRLLRAIRSTTHRAAGGWSRHYQAPINDTRNR